VVTGDSDSGRARMRRQHVPLQGRLSGKQFTAVGTPESFLSVYRSHMGLQAPLLGKFFPTESALRRTHVKLFVDAKHVPAKVHLGTVRAAQIPLPPLVNPDVAQEAGRIGSEVLAAPVAELARLVLMAGYQVADEARPPHHHQAAVAAAVFPHSSSGRGETVNGPPVSEQIGPEAEAPAARVTGVLGPRTRRTGCRVVFFGSRLN